MGKQKLQKIGSKGEEHGLGSYLHVKHLKQPSQDVLPQPMRTKNQRHHSSFQGGMRLVNPFKPMQTNSTTNSQLNDSGNGSGGN
jgi:hypothetical protein